MGEYIYMCHKCRHVFRLIVPDNSPQETETKCPKCDSTDTGEMSAWSPIGFTIHEGKSVWEYECQQCQNVFKLPVPSSPSQEKEIECPVCGGRHIHRLTSIGGVPLYCG